MKKEKLFVGVVLFIAALACSAPGAGSPDNEADSTSVAGTVVAQLETQNAQGAQPDDGNADGSTAAPDAPAATDTPVPVPPTNTPLPTNTTVPTATPSIPVISVSNDTNCRYGPGIVYDPPVDVLNVGETVEVYGRDSGSNFYYTSLGCWVWSNFVVLQGGNLGSVPVMTSPPTPTPTADTPWAGEWDTFCLLDLCGIMTLTQDGDTVTGTYADGDGVIDAQVDPENEDHLVGTWTRGLESGTIDFWFNLAGDKWRGNWDGTEVWCGTRTGEALPTFCGVSSWYGVWATDCGISGCSTMVLTQDGVNVSGTYADGTRTIEGTVDGLVLTGTWANGVSNGPITFYMISGSEGNQFQGNFNGTSAWCGKRNGQPYPVPCLKN